MASLQQGQGTFVEDLGLVADLEWDPIKNQQLGQTFHRPTEEQQLYADVPPSSIVAGAALGSGSYLAICPTTIQPLDSGHTFFVWQTHLHPVVRRRFKNAIITIKLSLPDNEGTSPPPLQSLGITAHAPQKAFGFTTEESKTFTWSLEIPISGQVGAVSSERPKSVEHAFTVIGTARGSPQRTACVWALEENSLSKKGLPSEIQLALLVEYHGAVAYEIDVRGEVDGGLDPPHWLRAKSNMNGRRKVLDPSKHSGKLREYNFLDVEKLQQLLATWTGEVEG